MSSACRKATLGVLTSESGTATIRTGYSLMADGIARKTLAPSRRPLAREPRERIQQATNSTLN